MPTTARARDLIPFARVALLVVAGDLASKNLAVSMLSGDETSLGGIGHAVRLAVVHNDRSAFGVTLGDHTWSINVALTVVAVLLAVAACRSLAALDTLAPSALGLIAGAALGNLVSLLTTPAGVVDFLAFDYGSGHEIVANFADLAAYAGVALTLRMCGVVGRAVHAQNLAVTPAPRLAIVRISTPGYLGWVVAPGPRRRR